MLAPLISISLTEQPTGPLAYGYIIHPQTRADSLGIGVIPYNS